MYICLYLCLVCSDILYFVVTLSLLSCAVICWHDMTLYVRIWFLCYMVLCAFMLILCAVLDVNIFL